VSDLIERWSKYQHGDVIADRFIVQDTIDEIERLEGENKSIRHQISGYKKEHERLEGALRHRDDLIDYKERQIMRERKRRIKAEKALDKEQT